jgi:hypothetical protein
VSLFEKVIGAIGGASFGGSTKITTNTAQETNVAVEVNPQVGVVVEPNISNVIDLTPVANALAASGAQGNAAIAALGEAVRRQGDLAGQAATVQAAATRDAATIQGALANASLQDAVAKVGELVKENLPVVLAFVGGALVLSRVK